ncbi:MAG: ABC transporter substrate-binding protein [Neisseria sp.]|uniref:ABC transporter substrate-binding protein n=1 Tax=Neisseria sp. TaxID=192066 RepID=UPI0026DAE202|nr:ABC transporter substrate-binding protein [Neisseria sp.]MDO4640325.1 ABC transporter substrate-binding protein [Neisseria sp.]
MNIRLLSAGIIAACLSACSPETQQSISSSGINSATQKRYVAITAITEHPSLDAIRKGIIDQLQSEGFEEWKNLKIDFQSAHGNTSTAIQIAKKFAGDNPDVIVPITTPSAQAVVAATQTIPVVYSGVTDPIGAKLVTSWAPSGTNVTGTSSQYPMAPGVALMQEIVPKLKTIGYVYSPGEINSIAILKQLREETEKHGIKVIDVPAQTTADVLAAARSLKGKVQLIYTGHDNNVVSAYPSMYKAATEMKIPLVAVDADSVQRGAVAAISEDDYSLGKDTGEMVARILRGEKPGAIASTRPKKFELYINPKHASAQGVTLPESLKKRADKILD